MLQEALLWCRARCLPAARRVGHLAEAIALEARSRRQSRLWQPHQARTRAAILRVAATCRQHRLAVVLGAGGCHDVPVEALATQFERVLLVDIVHLPGLPKRLRALNNVEWLTCDVTGVAEPLAARQGRLDGVELAALPLPDLALLTEPTIDFVASVNLLSQLPVKPVEYLQRQSPGLPIDALNAFAWRLLQHHVAQLQRLAVPVCLVTDDHQYTRAADQTVIEHTELIAPLDLSNQVFDRWHWPLAPLGELPGGMTADHEVVAIDLRST